LPMTALLAATRPVPRALPPRRIRFHGTAGLGSLHASTWTSPFTIGAMAAVPQAMAPAASPSSQAPPSLPFLRNACAVCGVPPFPGPALSNYADDGGMPILAGACWLRGGGLAKSA